MMSESKQIRLCDYDAYGFDIDHTIAKYNIPHLFDVSYQALAEYLVDQRGYDPYLLEPFDKDFCMRGLVLDTETGNIMKLSQDGTVIRASHGTKFMSEEEIIRDYGPNKHWSHFEEMINSVTNLDSCRIFENFFDIPGCLLCARLVDLADRKTDSGRAETYDFWQDVIHAYNDAYNWKQFKANRGGYFPSFKKETDKFLECCSRDVKDWLKRLKQTGKSTFIITSSYVDFASWSLQCVLGSDWKDYFDYHLFFARKPGFFSGDREFKHLVGFVEAGNVTELKEGESVSQGNVKMFLQSLAATTGKESPKVLFFGDSLRSDIFPAKRYVGWDTVMILEEMEAEVETLHEPFAVDSEGRETGPQPKRIKLQGPSQLEKEYLTSEQWGSLFTDDSLSKGQPGVKYMNTLWGYIIRKYADVAVPRLECITDYPLTYKLPVFNHEESRQWGFHPCLPVALQDKTSTATEETTSLAESENNSMGCNSHSPGGNTHSEAQQSPSVDGATVSKNCSNPSSDGVSSNNEQSAPKI